MVYNRIMKYQRLHFIAVFILMIFVVGSTSSALAYQAAPIAITKSASFITEKSVQLNGQVNSNDMPDAYAWFEWGVSGGSTVYETKHVRVSSRNNTLMNFKASISGLAPGTQYYFRQVIESSRGKDLGYTSYVTTNKLANAVFPLVIVETKEPLSLAENTVTLRGYVSPHGDRSTKAWFEWGTSFQLESKTTARTVSANSAFFENKLTNLAPGTAYYYRIVAENTAGRIYGVTRIFYTKGTPPPPPEVAISQTVSTPQSGGDGVSRTTSSTGAPTAVTTTKSNFNNSGDSVNNFPGAAATNKPGDFFGAIMSGIRGGNKDTSVVQVAGVAESSESGSLFGALFGNNNTTVIVEKVGDKDVPMHTPIEYRIAYNYKETSFASDAILKIIIPSDVVYIGDNTNNELLLEESSGGGERTYILPIGRMEKGSTRTISILGMTTGGSDGFPDARARLEYRNSTGLHVVASEKGSTKSSDGSNQSAAVKESGGFLPSSFLGWLFYVVLIVLIIIGVRKGREFYLQRKESITENEKDEDYVRLGQMIPEEEGVPVEA